MEPLLGRIEILERHVESLTQHTASVVRRLQWWRRLACSLTVLTVFSLPLSLGAGQEDRRWPLWGKSNHHDEDDDRDDKELSKLRQRVRVLERKLKHVASKYDENGLPEVVITGANLRIVNGLGSTSCTDEQNQSIPNCPNGLGNLIVGYNEPRGSLELFDDFGPDNRTGSHNIVVGQFHNFSRFGGIVVGALNEISEEFASVSGGTLNIASGFASTVSGGFFNRASSLASTVSGGESNIASGNFSSVSGGETNRASGAFSSVSGGNGNTADGFISSVSGGLSNTAEGAFSSLSGGLNRTTAGDFDWVAGGLFQDQ
jgi:hypothetical protein